jgi:hypothetical protein
MSSLKESFEDKKKDLSEDIQETKEAINKSVKKGVTITKRFFKRLLLVSFLGLLLFGTGYMVWANYTYSSGTRTGYLIKISKKGYVFKTYEGQLNLGGFQDSEQGNIVGNTWEFSLKRDDLYSTMQSLEGKQVQLFYREINKSMPWQGDTNYFVYKIEEK